MSDIDFSKSNQYILSIRFMADGFYFSVTDPSDESLLLEESFETDSLLSMTANLKKAFSKHELLKYNYNQVKATIQTQRFTLIPKEFFNEAQASAMFYHNLPEMQSEVVLHHQLENCDAVICFGIDKVFHSKLTEHYPQLEVKPHMADLLEQATEETGRQGNKALYASVSSNSMLVVVASQGRLTLCNNFDCNNTKDRLFFTLSCWKHTMLSQLCDKLVLCNHSQANEELMTELKKYIKDCSFA